MEKNNCKQYQVWIFCSLGPIQNDLKHTREKVMDFDLFAHFFKNLGYPFFSQSQEIGTRTDDPGEN
nr:hypothetical protein [uncultured Allomuricauda sp.]